MVGPPGAGISDSLDPSYNHSLNMSLFESNLQAAHGEAYNNQNFTRNRANHSMMSEITPG